MDLKLLHSLFTYDPKTGRVYWRKKAGRARPDNEAGTVDAYGYVRIMYKGSALKAHRIGWALYYNEEPPRSIDHINGVKNDNRIANLRGCTQKENSRNALPSKNNTSGYTGVARMRNSPNYRAYITVDRTQKHLGTFQTAEQAATAYNTAAIKYFGRFARLNCLPQPACKFRAA